MVNFALISGLSLMMIIITCLFQYEVMRIVWNLLPRLTVAPRLRVLLIVVPIFAIHIVNIWLYAAAFFLIEHFTSIGVLAGRNQFAGVLYESFVNALYFSATTYTSLGFGDIVPTNDLRMLTGAEVLNGLILIGWTVSFTYLTMEAFWGMSHGHKHRSGGNESARAHSPGRRPR